MSFFRKIDTSTNEETLENVPEIISEQLIGVIDGVNKVYKSSQDVGYILQVIWNGLNETHFTKTDTNEITFEDAPKAVGFIDILRIIYIKA